MKFKDPRALCQNKTKDYPPRISKDDDESFWNDM